MKKLALCVAVILAALAFAAGIYRKELTRLLAVDRLFDDDRIVANFSSMNAMFHSAPLPEAEAVNPFPARPQTLPQTVTARGITLNVEEFLERSTTTSLLVLQDGEVIYESYRLGTGKDDLRISWSMAKSVLSLSVGVAVERGLFDLDRTVDSYVPDLAGSAYEGVTVRQALQMASGVEFDEDYLDFWSDINRMGRVLAMDGSMDEFAAGVDGIARAPGSARQYVSIDTHVVAMALRAATGKSLPEWVGETVLGPLGIGDPAYYVTDGEDVAFALGGLNLTTRGYARIGQMVLQNGRFNGERMVDASWIAESTAISAPEETEDDGFGYGYQWWIPDETRSVALARGVYGQYIWVDRRNRMVVVKTSGDLDFIKQERVDETLAFLQGLASRDSWQAD